MSAIHTCLVTGAAGFIGSHLVDELLRRGFRVIGIDNLSAGKLQNLSMSMDHPEFEFCNLDVADAQALVPFAKRAKWIFHLAALADIVPSIQRPAEYAHSNVDGSFGVMEAARLGGVERVIYAASSSCYGIPDKYPTPESAPCRPQYPYALTKYLAEQIVMHWGKVYGIGTVSLRLFNVYGPRARTNGTYGAVFGVFLAQKLANRPFTIVGDGTQTRDFTFVSDVVEAFIMAAKSDLDGRIMNVGTSNPVSVNTIAKLLEGPCVNIPKRPGEPDCTHADISRINELLAWSPKVDIGTGIGMLLKNINDFNDAPVWTPESIAKATRPWFEYLGDHAGPQHKHSHGQVSI